MPHLWAQVLTEAEIARILKEANVVEADAAHLASRKAQNPQIKAFAQKLRQDHQRSEKEIKHLAKQLHLKMKKSPELQQLQSESEKSLSELKTVETPQFVKTYILSQLQMHQQILDNIDNKFLPAVTTPELKNYLEKIKTHVQNHLNDARSLQSILE